jgi:WD40 repeat protein
VRAKQICTEKIKAIAFISSSQVVVSASDVHFVTIAPKMEVTESLSHDKKRSKKKSETPDLIGISPNGKLMLTADRKGSVCVRSIHTGEETKDDVNWSITAHQDRITVVAFITDELLATASANVSDACCVWKIGHDQPVVILDRPTSLTAV